MQGYNMEILFESNTEIESEFEFEGEVIVNKGLVQIFKGDPFNLGMENNETEAL
jgi:hypothetical protein